MIKTRDVFTPGAPSVAPNLLWAPRKDDVDFVNILSTQGKHAYIYGESGIGKTSLVSRLLRQNHHEHFIYTCDQHTSTDNIFEIILDNLRSFKIDEQRIHKSFEGEIATNAWLGFLTGRTKALVEKELVQKPWHPKATKETLLRVLTASGLSLVVDDLEKISDSHLKGLLADFAKLLSDRAYDNLRTKLVVIEASQNPYELVKCAPKTKSRLTPYHIAPISTDSIRKYIFEEGFKRLSITSSYRFLNGISGVCCGSPKVAHAIGLHLSDAALKSGNKITTHAIYIGMKNAIEKELIPEFYTAWQLLKTVHAKSPMCRYILEIIALSSKLNVSNQEISNALTARFSKPYQAAHFAKAIQYLKSSPCNVLRDGDYPQTHQFSDRLMRIFVMCFQMQEVLRERVGIEDQGKAITETSNALDFIDIDLPP